VIPSKIADLELFYAIQRVENLTTILRQAPRWNRTGKPVLKRASPDGVNEDRLEADATLLFGASSDSSRSCGKTITPDPPRHATA
jgi:hypothetical protein